VAEICKVYQHNVLYNTEKWCNLNRYSLTWSMLYAIHKINHSCYGGGGGKIRFVLREQSVLFVLYILVHIYSAAPKMHTHTLTEVIYGHNHEAEPKCYTQYVLCILLEHGLVAWMPEPPYRMTGQSKLRQNCVYTIFCVPPYICTRLNSNSCCNSWNKEKI
jgi:hypothetical protein